MIASAPGHAYPIDFGSKALARTKRHAVWRIALSLPTAHRVVTVKTGTRNHLSFLESSVNKEPLPSQAMTLRGAAGGALKSYHHLSPGLKQIGMARGRLHKPAAAMKGRP